VNLRELRVAGHPIGFRHGSATSALVQAWSPKPEARAFP
jgi:hypothetical protein